MSDVYSNLTIYRTTLEPETGRYVGDKGILFWVWEWKLSGPKDSDCHHLLFKATTWSDLESELFSRKGEILPVLNALLPRSRWMSDDNHYYEYSCEFMSLLMDKIGRLQTL